MRMLIDKCKNESQFAVLNHAERGAASIEYAILGSLVAAVIVFVVASLGTQVRILFETLTNSW